MKPVINLDEVPLTRHSHGEKFEALDGGIGHLIGTRQLGCSITVVPPGKRAWPFHCHHVNEEMAFILEGTGTLRVGDREFPIRAGDLISSPAGGAESAHQMVNTSKGDLRYLALSTMIPQDVIEYPDSKKFAVRVGSAPGGDPAQRTFSLVARKSPDVDYWDSE